MASSRRLQWLQRTFSRRRNEKILPSFFFPESLKQPHSQMALLLPSSPVNYGGLRHTNPGASSKPVLRRFTEDARVHPKYETRCQASWIRPLRASLETTAAEDGSQPFLFLRFLTQICQSSLFKFCSAFLRRRPPRKLTAGFHVVFVLVSFLASSTRCDTTRCQCHAAVLQKVARPSAQWRCHSATPLIVPTTGKMCFELKCLTHKKKKCNN